MSDVQKISKDIVENYHTTPANFSFLIDSLYITVAYLSKTKKPTLLNNYQ